MIHLRAPIAVAIARPSVRVGAFSPNVDYITKVTVPTVVGGLFGAVLWGLKGALIGGGAGAVVGYTIAHISG